MHASGPIGIFDSGIGGLSVFEEIKKLLPSEDLVYFADSIHLPYGDRSIEDIYNFSESIVDFLMQCDCKTIVIACNTASAAALHPLREKYPEYTFTGMEPAVKPAVENTATGKVGVIATIATFQGQLFKSVVERFAKDVEVIAQACPGLVQQIEAGKLDSPETENMLRVWIEPLLAQGIDRLVLGCTHYPFVIKTIKKITGDHVEIIDPAPAVARQVQRVLESQSLQKTDPTHASYIYITTGAADKFIHTAELLHLNISDVKEAEWSGSNIIMA